MLKVIPVKTRPLLSHAPEYLRLEVRKTSGFAWLAFGSGIGLVILLSLLTERYYRRRYSASDLLRRQSDRDRYYFYTDGKIHD